jgi:hypothetical protein
MSIYHSRQKRPADPGQAGDSPSTGQREAAADGAVPYAPPPQNVARLRKAAPIETLLPASRQWLEGLPADVRPVELAKQYARVVNLIAQQWNDHSACRAYFDELLKGRRESRRGFPAVVRAELRGLRHYHERLRVPTGDGLALV